jgi:Na+/H+ antiporter NhaD/arsenite permease-like protein
MTAVAVAVFVGAYVLIATEWVHRLVAVLGGAAILFLLGVTDAQHACYSHDTGIDWDVIFLLLGMMIIVGVLRRTGVFECIAIWAAKRAKGSPLRVMILLTLITAGASAFLDNVTTVLHVAPVTLLVCERLDGARACADPCARAGTESPLEGRSKRGRAAGRSYGRACDAGCLDDVVPSALERPRWQT